MQKIFDLKKNISIILFIAFAFRPIYHTGYIAYFKCNIDTIIEKYCVNKDKPILQCNGKCHLAKKIRIDVDLSDNNTKGITTSAEAFFPVFKENNFNYSFKNLLFVKKKEYWKLKSLYSITFINALKQPPDYIS